MAFRRTTNCARHGHREFQITYDPAVVVVEDDIAWLIDWLEQSVAQGERYSAGQMCQIGWIVTQVRQRDDGDLTIWEPDMQSMPVVWSESVSCTLAHIRAQKDVVESVLEADGLSFPSMRESAIICTRLGQTEGMVMERVNPKNTDSGWFCGCRGEDHDHNDVAELRRVSLYEAAVCHAPQIVPYLALPSEVLIGVGGDAPMVFRDGEPLEIRPGSYLAIRHAIK